MNTVEKKEFDWAEDDGPNDPASSEATFWGETQIHEIIHEANQRQCDPEQLIKDKKAGVGDQVSEMRAFRTIYQKPRRSFWKRLLKWK